MSSDESMSTMPQKRAIFSAITRADTAAAALSVDPVAAPKASCFPSFSDVPLRAVFS